MSKYSNIKIWAGDPALACAVVARLELMGCTESCYYEKVNTNKITCVYVDLVGEWYYGTSSGSGGFSHSGRREVATGEILGYVKVPLVSACFIKVEDEIKLMQLQEQLFQLGFTWQGDQARTLFRPTGGCKELILMGNKISFSQTAGWGIARKYFEIFECQLQAPNAFNSPSNTQQDDTTGDAHTDTRPITGICLRRKVGVSRVASSEGLVGNKVRVGKVKSRIARGVLNGTVLSTGDYRS